MSTLSYSLHLGSDKNRKPSSRNKEERDKNYLSQQNVSKSIGITQSHYATYENGHNTIPITRLLKLSKLYNVSLDYLMGKCS